MNLQMIATCGFGLEAVVGRELRAMGIDNQVGTGLVRFQGDMAVCATANLWLRCADRVLVELATFPALTYDQLFEGVKAVRWEDWLSRADTFPVEGWCVQSQLMSVSDCQSISKKAIVERLKTRYHQTWFDETGPVYRIRVGILRNNAHVYLDTSGHGLHRRGYRPHQLAAPLHETLAAGCIYQSRWHTDQFFWDPCCGSGTIAIEAAMMAAHIAPGMHASFEAEMWRQSDSRIWRDAREQAQEGQQLGDQPTVFASDIDPAAVELTRKHARNAGVAQMLHIQRQDMRQLQTSRARGVMVLNPPYGLRLGDAKDTELLYRDIALVWRRLPQWSIHILTAHPQFERVFGRRADKRTKLYNGGLVCQLYGYWQHNDKNKNTLQKGEKV